ncbi:polysaccharide biosynthesis tyrosine autokinase [Microbacterium sp. NPDC057407]|uniref:polysaccharide biosynthesis tyrosine autokinase n=1 Tax=Microbacterium sp. NPDC057407 TaxID=3346120 RepID=UPI00366AB24E
MADIKTQVTPGRIFRVLLRAWWVIVLAGLLGGLLAFGYSSTLAPVYQSTASTYFSMRSASSGSDINQGSAYTQSQMLSFAQLAMSSVVLDEVRADLDADLTNSQIRNMTTVTIPQNTVILDVTAGSTDPDFAAEVANSVAENLAQVVDEISPKDDAGNATVVARVIEPATPAAFQSSPNKQRDAVLGAFAGALLAALGIAVWTLLDTRVRSEDALRRITDLPVLGGIPRRKDKSRRALVVSEPNSTSAEAYRRVRSSLRFAAVEHEISAIAVTSSIPGEGKTSTAVNLALTYAEAGLRVLIVDADLRRPMVAETLGLENSVGLTTMLVGAVDFEGARLPWGDTSLWVLPAGEVPPNPAELLASVAMTELLRELRAQFDVMIVDTAPLLSVSDATIIAQSVDTTIVVADVTKVHLAQLGRSLEALDRARAQVAGVLFSRVKRQRGDDYNYYYYGPSGGRRQRTAAPQSRRERRGGKPASVPVEMPPADDRAAVAAAEVRGDAQVGAIDEAALADDRHATAPDDASIADTRRSDGDGLLFDDEDDAAAGDDAIEDARITADRGDS